MHTQVLRRSFTIWTCFFDLQLYSATGMWSKTFINMAFISSNSSGDMREWSKGEVLDTLYGMSEKGWTDQELFYYWLTELFVKQIPPARPVMLLVDGHSSHYEPESIRAAAEQSIIVFCLPPHSTHITQSLNVSFFVH